MQKCAEMRRVLQKVHGNVDIVCNVQTCAELCKVVQRSVYVSKCVQSRAKAYIEYREVYM